MKSRNIKMGFLTGLIVILGIFVVLSGFNIYAETENKATATIGYVDIKDVFDSHPQRESSIKALDEEAKALQVQLEEEIKEVDQEEWKGIFEKYQELLSQKEQELTLKVLEAIDETIVEVANEIGVKVVLEKENVIYGGEDLTDKVKERIQQKFANR
ncbi:MAG: OmpH family outer membrane protein [Halanaerobiales bacterium]|nr:OmpH family outer membrane protein [Halanaerobiales bacterium]